jgi:hypothetical protein
MVSHGWVLKTSSRLRAAFDVLSGGVGDDFQGIQWLKHILPRQQIRPIRTLSEN